jgi:hypothetical protein
MVDITTFRVVDDSAWVWIFWVMCNIVIHEHNDVLILQASFLQYLVCVAHISLPYHTPTTSVSMEMFVFFSFSAREIRIISSRT